MNEPESFQSTASAITDSEGRRVVEVRAYGVTFHDSPEHARTFGYSLLSAATAVELDGEPGEATEPESEEEEADAFDAKLRSILSTWAQSPAGEWPLTLTCGRDGIGYLAFPFDLEDVPPDVCERGMAAFWMIANEAAPFGRGETPEAALIDLRAQAAKVRAETPKEKR